MKIALITNFFVSATVTFNFNHEEQTHYKYQKVDDCFLIKF